jgi:protein involved in polysaccharide export with SLBB domain
MMNKKSLVLFAGLFALAAVLSALGQTQSQSPTQTQTPSSTQPSTQTQSPSVPPDMQSLLVDGQGNKRYLVGPGDVLDVRVFGQSDLNSTVEIDEDGNISSLPFLEEPIPAKCRNEKDIQKSIAEAYSKYLKKPRVSVRVVDRKSRPPAVVFGAVRAPTRVQMMRRVRLHELLVAAGGITLGASGAIQIIHTEKVMCPQDLYTTLDIASSTPDTPVVTSTNEKAPASTSSDKPVLGSASNKPIAASAYTGPTTISASDKQTSTVASNKQEPASNTDKPAETSALDKPISDIGQIVTYKMGDVRFGTDNDDPYIRPGDIVIVTEGEPIYITGAVIAPREIVMKDGMTLQRALSMAGGLQKLAKSHEVHVYRQVKGKIGSEKLTFDYDAIKNGKAPDVLLQAYDIIDVRNQSSFSPDSLKEMLKGITMGSMGGIAGSLPYRVIP